MQVTVLCGVLTFFIFASETKREGTCPGSDPFVDDNVVPLCAEKFPSSSESGHWAVLFYGHKCRHCREVALALREAAKLPKTKSRHRSVKYGAVDCHHPKNNQLCQEHGIWKYPSLKAIGCSSSYTGANEALSIHKWAVSATGADLPRQETGVWPHCPAYELYDEPRIAREFLRAHNVYRCTAGLRLLQWDGRAFTTAQRWATQSPVDRLKHSPEELRQGRGRYAFGENVAIGDWLEPGRVVARWYDEIRSTPGGRGVPRAGQAGIGHYTQIVWRSTRRVGCSFGQQRRVAVCHYDPPGNQQGRYMTQVAPPVPGYAGLEGEERCGGPVADISA